MNATFDAADTGLGSRIRHAWDAFANPPQRYTPLTENGEFISPAYGFRQDRIVHSFNNGRDTVTAIYNQISLDVTSLSFRHAKVDEDGRFKELYPSGLDECLNVSANIDQTGAAFIQDAVLTLFEEGVIAILPVETTIDPKVSGSYDIRSLRVGKIVSWHPSHVMVNAYNEKNGLREDVLMRKRDVALVENPLYSVMNEPNGTLKRLQAKLALLDSVDNQLSSGKLDIIIQLPYVIRTDEKRLQAEKRRKDIEMQLHGSKYGIAYTDGTEKITQLNRPAENNLLEQVNKLTEQLYAQLGLTTAVFDGTADERTMLNYYNRTTKPIAKALADAMHRTFLTKTARTQGQAVIFFRDPFQYMPMSDMADMAEKFIRNRVTTPNEIRGSLGYRPHEDPAANQLQNPNIDVRPTDQPAVPSMPGEGDAPIEVPLPEEAP